ncbi:hypothetical protein BDFB_005358 [Asbolus verrucosus]|uniref:Uncharacterized protein n=1 Tax=Asbolus verrucosus TaxID=1661398 RepID=A0A482VSB7_ASBVE|nr:hypothetical protein BDFB_005358 [Asbolus verrucosus]
MQRTSEFTLDCKTSYSSYSRCYGVKHDCLWKVFIQGILNAESYIGQVLEPVVLAYFEDLQNATFQQDNARPQTGEVTRQFLENRNMIP